MTWVYTKLRNHVTDSGVRGEVKKAVRENEGSSL